MPVSLNDRIAVNISLCERTLQEKDDVVTVIRVVDIFYFTRDPDATPEKPQVVPMSMLVVGKFPPHDLSEHTIQLKVLEPDGTLKDLSEPKRQSFPRKVQAAPSGFTSTGRFGVPAIPGTYYLIVLIDEVERGCAQFTILERPAATQTKE
jgi:hypothetical protein